VIGAANRPSIIAVMGSTGSGKSEFIKRELMAPMPRRLLVWDFNPEQYNEYGSYGATVDLTQLIRSAGAAGRAGDIRLVFHPSDDDKRRPKEFDLFCSLALRLGNLTMLVEELKFVTRANWAPMPWAKCLLLGRKIGLRIIGTSQRPAHIDKDFLGNANVIRVGILGHPPDREAVSQAMGVELAEVERLAALDWLMLTKEPAPTITKGRLSF
jgi:hypothetical protein